MSGRRAEDTGETGEVKNERETEKEWGI